jgi:hypothetical protein
MSGCALQREQGLQFQAQWSELAFETRTHGAFPVPHQIIFDSPDFWENCRMFKSMRVPQTEHEWLHTPIGLPNTARWPSKRRRATKTIPIDRVNDCECIRSIVTELMDWGSWISRRPHWKELLESECWRIRKLNKSARSHWIGLHDESCWCARPLLAHHTLLIWARVSCGFSIRWCRRSWGTDVLVISADLNNPRLLHKAVQSFPKCVLSYRAGLSERMCKDGTIVRIDKVRIVVSSDKVDPWHILRFPECRSECPIPFFPYAIRNFRRTRQDGSTIGILIAT